MLRNISNGSFGKNISSLNKNIPTAATVYFKISQEFCFTLGKKAEIRPAINPSPKYFKCNWKSLCKYEHFCKNKTKTHPGMCFVLQRSREELSVQIPRACAVKMNYMSPVLTRQLSASANCQLCFSAPCLPVPFKVIVTTKMVSENHTEMNHFPCVLRPVKTALCAESAKYVNHIFLCLYDCSDHFLDTHIIKYKDVQLQTAEQR